MAGDRDPRTGVDPRRIGGIPLRAFAPNAITALALCFGLTGVRFAIGEEWEKALAAVIFAGV
ncbi:MAG: CDP-diacylglycerol O-phosphatidyltransferase, partial [Sphingopyxis terrae]